jgi:hypothetical protein
MHRIPIDVYIVQILTWYSSSVKGMNERLKEKDELVKRVEKEKDERLKEKDKDKDERLKEKDEWVKKLERDSSQARSLT